MIFFTLMSSVAYAINIIKYAVKKKKDATAEKPVWNVSVVAWIVTALFLVYFFVPTT